MIARNFIFFLILNLLILDIVVGFLFYKTILKDTQTNILQTPPEKFESTEERIETCASECRSYVDEKLAETFQTTSTPSPQPTQNPPKEAKVRRVTYVPIPGFGSTDKSDVWADLASTEFYLDKGDFPGFLEAFFEANIHLVNGNGRAMVRLYDATHSIAVVGSEVETANQKSTLVVSEKLNIWSGKNLYRVQAKSLTADTTIFDSGRIKIIYEE